MNREREKSFSRTRSETRSVKWNVCVKKRKGWFERGTKNNTRGNVNFQHDTFRFTLLVTHFLPSHKATSRFSLLYQQLARRPPNWFTSSILFSLWSSADRWRNPVRKNPRGRWEECCKGCVYPRRVSFLERIMSEGGMIASTQRLWRETHLFRKNKLFSPWKLCWKIIL